MATGHSELYETSPLYTADKSNNDTAWRASQLTCIHKKANPPPPILILFYSVI